MSKDQDIRVFYVLYSGESCRLVSREEWESDWLYWFKSVSAPYTYNP